MNPHHDVRSISNHFAIHGDFRDAAPYGTGHINDTYCATYDRGGTRRFLRARLTIFPCGF